jgi:hypothetical protein
LIELVTILPSGSADAAVEAVTLAGAVIDPVTALFVATLVTLNAAVGGWFVTVS